MASSNKRRAGGALILLLLLLLFAGGFGGTPPEDDKDKGKDDDKNECPPGMVRNAARLRLLTSGLKGAELAAELEKYPLCVPEVCPPGTRRDEFGKCVPVTGETCPPGYVMRDGACVPTDDENDCPPNQVRNLARLRLLGSGLTGAALEAELAKYPVCVPQSCRIGQVRDSYGRCIFDPNEPPPPGIEDPTPADVDDLIKVYPTPKSFYQVIKDDAFTGDDGIATKLARSCLFLAAKQVGGLDDDAAREWASARDGWAAQAAVTRKIACVPINDGRFGTFAFTVGKAMPGPNGRAIRLLPMNADDRERIRASLPMIRNVRMGKPGDPPTVSNGGIDDQFNEFEFLWLPEFNLELLWSSNGTVWEFAGTWRDGSATYNPPPAIYGLGITNYDGQADVTLWGCAPQTEEIS